MKEELLIAGAGPAGLSLARQLLEIKYPFKLIEKMPSLSNPGLGIALPKNAVDSLEYLGLFPKLKSTAYRVNEINYGDERGRLLSRASLNIPPFSGRFYAMPRASLLEILFTDKLKPYIHFNTEVKSLLQHHDGVEVEFNNGKSEVFAAVIAADGIHSSIRKMVCPEVVIEDLGFTTYRWINKTLTNPSEPVYLVGKNAAFMAYPITADRVYCYAQIYDPVKKVFQSKQQREDLQCEFGGFGGVAKVYLDALPYSHSILSSRLQTLSHAVLSKGLVAFCGDAGHGCSPQLQQGVAQAFEDTITLASLLAYFKPIEALKHYQDCRQARVDWVRMASDDPIRGLVGISDDNFKLFKQQVEANGPLNVGGWRKLLAEDPLEQVKKLIDNLSLIKQPIL